MSSIQVVFLFDLNACADFLFSPKEEIYRRLLSVRLASLRLLSYFSSKYPNLKWGAKFFDTQGSKNQTMCKFAFNNLSLENFETFENEICVRYERHLSILRALLESSQNDLSSVNNTVGDEANVALPVKILQLALTQVLCEFQWESMDMWSPSYSKIKKRKRNYLFVFSDFKDNDEILHKFFGLSNSLSKPKFLNLFLPQSLQDSIVKKADIHLVLINMCEDQKFMGCFSSKFLSLLSDSLNSLPGSFIPLYILSQPSYDLKLLNILERSMCQEKELMLLSFPAGFQNSFIPFSTLFEQSMNHLFYSSTNTLIYDCYIDFRNRNIQIPIQIMEISNKNPDLCEDVSESAINSEESSCGKNYQWSKFNFCCVVPTGAHFPVCKFLLCLSSSYDSNTSYTCGLLKLIKYLNIGGFSLLLECVTEDGKMLPGFLNSLSCDTAIVLVFDPSVTLKIGYKIPDCSFSKNQDFENFLDQMQYICDKNIDFLNNVTIDSNAILKPFQIQSLENKFKPQKINSLAPQTLNNPFKMVDYSNILRQSAVKNRGSNSKQTSVCETESNALDQIKITDEKIPDTKPICDVQIPNLADLPCDVTYKELISAIRDVYDSAIESESVSVETISKTIMKTVMNYCKKHYGESYKEHVSAILRDSVLMNTQLIIQKYDSSDDTETMEKALKECQILILLNFEVENLELNSDKLDFKNTVTSLLKTANLYFTFKEILQLDGRKEKNIFLNEVLKKNYSDNLQDVLEECTQGFEDSEGSPVNSPAETISSEFNNEEEFFSSVISSNLSEKSSSSPGSCKISSKDVKNKNTLERKLLRRRSDISDSARYRQVLLPKSSPKKKKAKAVANKAVRHSPRLAAKRNDHKSACEKTNKARRNLFSGDKVYRTPKKNDNHSTTRSKKKNLVSKTKLAAETPAHKQNYSSFQRRKSFMDQSNSPKVIAESPTVRKASKDDASKELLEKLLKTRHTSCTVMEQKPTPPSFNDFTPESKRRLSLKLFSKLLNSPTARQGIRKCTKRLFDQISPQKSVESCKKFKAAYKSEESFNLLSKNETQS